MKKEKKRIDMLGIKHIPYTEKENDKLNKFIIFCEKDILFESKRTFKNSVFINFDGSIHKDVIIKLSKLKVDYYIGRYMYPGAISIQIYKPLKDYTND